MGWLSVHIHRQNDVSKTWYEKAESGLNDMDGQLDSTVFCYNEGTVSVDVGDDYNEMLDNWIDYIENNDIVVGDYDVHLLIIDDLSLGAGAERGDTVGPNSDSVFEDSGGCAGFVNAAVRWNHYCYGSDDVFPPTVVHEVGHTALHDDMPLPDGDNEHSMGGVDKLNNKVKPMQLWHTDEYCSGNSPPEDNCPSHDNEDASGATTELSWCSNFHMDKFLDNSYSQNRQE